MSHEQLSPTELEPILKIASDCGLILVGGQAVGCWATLLENPAEEPWKSRRPYTSRDADALCTRNQMLQFAKTLAEHGWDVEVFEPDKNEERIHTGAIRIEGMIGKQRQTLVMNLLKQLEGLSNQEIEETATEIPIAQSSIRSIDVLRLLESKTISLNSLDQTGRQDETHLILCVAALKRILQETGKGPEWPNALKSAQRIIQNANHQIGLDTLTRHQINLLDAIPWDAWRQAPIPGLQKLGHQERDNRNGMMETLHTAAELEQWLKTLHSKTRQAPATPESPGNPN